MEHKFHFKGKPGCRRHVDSFLNLVATSPKLMVNGTFEGSFVTIQNPTDARLVHESGNFGWLSSLSDTESCYLKLTLQESFFLLYGLGCLQVRQKNEDQDPISIVECWRLFSSVRADFMKTYAVYHYFRVKGWVVKGGEKFGSDFVLYKKGPQCYHSTYAIVIDTEDEQKNWMQLLPVIRVAESASKHVLVARVSWPAEMTLPQLKQSPSNLHLLTVNEMLVKRWLP